MSVSINGDQTIAQPTILTESILQIQTDQEAIDGSMQRNKIGQKHQADIEWDWLTPTQYQLLITYMTTGSGIVYSNNQSNYTGGTLTISGLPSFQEQAYIQGSSLYRKITATVREI